MIELLVLVIVIIICLVVTVPYTIRDMISTGYLVALIGAIYSLGYIPTIQG